MYSTSEKREELDGLGSWTAFLKKEQSRHRVVFQINAATHIFITATHFN